MIAVSPVVRRCHGDRFDRRLSMLMIVNRKHKSLGCRACWLYDGVAHAGTVANTVVARTSMPSRFGGRPPKRSFFAMAPATPRSG